MRVEDISPLNEFATSSQSDAIANINTSKLFNLDPVTFKNNRDQLLPEAERISLPQRASRTVAQVMEESPEHTAAVAPDAESLSLVEKIWHDTKNKTSAILGPRQRMTDLYFKKLSRGNPALEKAFGTFNEDDELDLLSLKDQEQDNFGEKAAGLEDSSWGIVGDTASAVADMGAVIARNKALIGTIMGGGAVLGGTTGLVGGPVTGVAGALAGAGVGFTTGYATASFYNSYKQMAASTYEYLDDKKADDNGQPIDDLTKQNIAHGVGLIGGGISAVADKLFLRNLPFIKKFVNPKEFNKIIASNPGLKAAVLNIGKSIAAEGGEEGLQEIVQIVGEEIGSSYKNGETSLIEGIQNAANKIANDPKTQKRVGRSTVVGGIAGAAVHVSLGAAEKGINHVNEHRAEKAAMRKRAEKIIADPTPSSDGNIDVNIEGQNVVAVPRPTTDMIPTAPLEQAAVNILEFQNAVEETSKLEKSTGIAKESPEMMNKIRTQILNNAGVKNVWVSKEDLQDASTDEETGDFIRNAIDKTGTAAAARNGMISLPMQTFYEILDKGIPIDEFVRLHPEGPNSKEAKQFAKNIEDMTAKRAEITKRLGAMGEKTPEQRAAEIKLAGPDVDTETITKALESKEVADAYIKRLDENAKAEKDNPEQLQMIAAMKRKVEIIKEVLPDETNAKATLKQALEDSVVPPTTNEMEFLTEPVFTKPIEGILSKAEVTEKNEAVRASKQEVANNIHEAAQYEMNQIIDIQEQEAVDAQKEMDLQKLENSMLLSLVDKFNPPGSKEKKSAYAIDPKYLTKEQKEKYLKDPRLKAHKVFNKEGIHPDDAAAFVGVQDGESLLHLLSMTPPRNEIAETQAEMFRPTFREEAIRNTDLHNIAIAESYRNKVANDLETAEIMREAHWSATKKGIKRAALPLPRRIQEIQVRAKNVIDNTKIGDLNVNQFKVAARKNHKLAVESELKGDYATAAKAKEDEALNTELALQTHIAIGESNKIIKYTRRFRDPKVKQTLIDAGPSYVAAVDELLGAWNFNKSKKLQAERGSFQKWVKEQVANGRGDFQIPDRLSDLRESVNDMTVDQIQVIGNRLKSVLEVAKYKNELYMEYGEPAQKANALNVMANDFHEKAIQHRDYKEDRGRNEILNLSPYQATLKLISDGTSILKGMEHIILDADLDVVGGFLNEHLMAPLKGSGKYKNQGEAGKSADSLALQIQFKKIIETFGIKEWADLKNTLVFVEEFENNPRLKNGQLTLWNLLMLQLNMGNESNRDAMVRKLSEYDENGEATFTTSIDTITTVLNAHLSEKHAVLTQNIWNLYDSYWNRVKTLHEETTGVIPKRIEAATYDHKGKRYKGGYFPVRSESKMNLDKVVKKFKHDIKMTTGDVQSKAQSEYHADDMTKHTHTEERHESLTPLDLDSGLGLHFEMLIHDLNFRKPIADALRILTHPSISKDITNIVGLSHYNVLVNTVVRAASSFQAENTRLFDSTNMLNKIEAKFRNGIQTGYLLFNASSIMIQPTSMIYATERMGRNGVPHLVNTIQQLAKNPMLIKDFYEFAAEINPAIRDALQGIDENLTDPLRRLEPKKNYNKVTRGYDKMTEVVKDVGFGLLLHADQIQKVTVTLAAYSQFMAGDAEGHPLSKIQKMTVEERDHAAKVYAASVARLTLTTGTTLDRAPIQQLKWLTMFYNDARNSINNTMRQGNKIRWTLEDKHYGDAAGQLAAMVVTLTVIRMMTDIVRGYNTPWSREGKNGYAAKKFSLDKIINKPFKFGKEMAWYVASSPYNTTIGNVPFLRDIEYTDQTQREESWRQKEVMPVVAKPINDIYLGTQGLLGLAQTSLYYAHIVKHKGDVTKKELESLGFLLSYASKNGLPVKGAMKLFKLLNKAKRKVISSSMSDDVHEVVDDVLTNHADEIGEDEKAALEDIDSKLSEPEESSELDKTDE